MTISVTWHGLSGQEYTYSIHKIDWVPTADQDGNYIFARAVLNGWEAVYVAQGDLRKRRQAALDEGCVQRKRATRFHCHINARKDDRLAEEEDVLDGNIEAYVPEGCNERPGG